MEPIYQSRCTAARSIFPGNVGLNYWRVQSDHTSHKNSGESRYEVEHTKTNEEQRGGSKQASTQAPMF